MGKQQKSRQDSSGGEDFNFDAANNFSEDSSEVEIIENDTWQPIVLGQKAKRDEYDKASKSDILDE